MVEERKLAVLRAIVEDYVSTQEPVGSKALVERHQLGVSPATVRNDMAALEEEGLIAQPHTSAGRVPTDKGYRLFVDRLSQVKPLTQAERRAITTLARGRGRPRRRRTALGAAARPADPPGRDRAVPDPLASTVRHVELVTLSATRLLLVLILSTGRVEQRVVELPDALDDEQVASFRHRRQPAPSSGSGSPTRRRSSPTCRRPSTQDDRPVLSMLVDRARRGDVRPPLRRAGHGRRHREPRALRRRLRRHDPAAARGARGARACCSSCSARRRRPHA